jgi:alanyl-tRNA synthetase
MKKTQTQTEDATSPIRTANRLISLIKTANELRETARAAAAANTERLQNLDMEIAALDQKMNADDFPALHELAARRDQRVRLAKKFSEDAAAADRAADAAADAVTDSEISNLFWAIKNETKARIIAAVSPFVSDAARAGRIAETCDCILLLNRHACTWGSLPASPKLAGLLPVLRSLVAGNPPWVFGETSTENQTNQ